MADVVVLGPNLPSSDQTFHVHAAGCSDIMRSRTYRYLDAPESRTDVLSYSTLRELVEDWYGDQMGDNVPGDPWATWEPYASDFRVFPCVGELPSE